MEANAFNIYLYIHVIAACCTLCVAKKRTFSERGQSGNAALQRSLSSMRPFGFATSMRWLR